MTEDSANKFSVLFVCTGNICRSPLAQGIFEELVKKRNCEERFSVDSCGTAPWNVGHPPHPEVLSIARENGISIDHQRARVLAWDDFENFDLLVAMDQENLQSLEFRGQDRAARICLLREYDPEVDLDYSVPDPYHTGDFQGVYDIIQRSCEALLDELEKGG